MWKKAVFGTVSASFIGYVVWVCCLSSTRHRIEWDLATRVTAVLERTGFSEVVPVVDGRDVELQGQVSSMSEAQRAERMVTMIRGVRVVRSRMFVVDEEDLGGGDT